MNVFWENKLMLICKIPSLNLTVGMVTWRPIKIDYGWSGNNVKKFDTEKLSVFIK